MAQQVALPRLPPGMRNANSRCYRVTQQGEDQGRFGLGDPIEGWGFINLRLRNPANAVIYVKNLPVADVQEVDSANCVGIPLGHMWGGRKTYKKNKKRVSRTRRLRRAH